MSDYVISIVTRSSAPGEQGPPGLQGPAGVNGTDGFPGQQGSDGSPGPMGPAGANGTPGSVWYQGSGVPSDAIGIAGDYFFRTDTGGVYIKGAFSWGAPIANMTGATGAAGANGSSVLNGSGAPASGLGSLGDFYIDTTAHSIYGPKTGGGWGSSTSLVGPAAPVIPGIDGQDGLDAPIIPGSQGAPGINAPVIPGVDGEDGQDAPIIPGPPGADGSAGFVNQGTTTTVLHGNASGAPSFGAVVEADMNITDNTTRNVSSTAHGFQAKDSFALVGRQILTAGSGTYTPTAGTRAILIELQGGGAGGGEGVSNGSSTSGAASGGGCGGYSRLLITAPESSYDYVVGDVANGGSATGGPNNGTAGNASTFSHHAGAVILNCNGGAAGLGAGAAGTYFKNPVLGGTATGGDVNIAGGIGCVGIQLAYNNILGGNGGSGVLGVGGRAGLPGAGSNGVGYGAGGGGGSATSVTGNVAGGNGAAGLLIVWEFK